jgi:hypothetical protein
MTHVLAPPKPRDVLSVARSFAGLASQVDRPRLGNSTSSRRTFAHGGTVCASSAIAERISSTAPAPPSV